MPLPTDGKGLDLLYLDLDGCLHHEAVFWSPKRGPYLKAPEKYKLFEHASLLEELLAPYPEVRIILSTSWVVRYGYLKASKKLTPGLRARCIGSTYHYGIKGDAWHHLSRGEQVTRDAAVRQPRSWLALDDDGVDWPVATLGNFIQTDPYEGIGLPDIQAAIRERLQSMAASGTN